MSEQIKYIYGLVCPIREQIRYVGQTFNPQERFNQHLNDFYRNPKGRWLKRLKVFNMCPLMIILEEVSEYDALAKEEEWMGKLYNEGHKLFNREIRAKRKGYYKRLWSMSRITYSQNITSRINDTDND